MDEYDKKEIESLLDFKERLLCQIEAEKDLTYEERIKRHLARWRGEL